VPDCNSSARRAELSSLHKGSNWRCFVSSKEEPPAPDCSSSSRRVKLCSLRKGARQTAARGRKEVYGGQQLLTHHGDEALLCRFVASPRPPAAIDGAACVTICRRRDASSATLGEIIKRKEHDARRNPHLLRQRRLIRRREEGFHHIRR
jgi:hypothetical protein